MSLRSVMVDLRPPATGSRSPRDSCDVVRDMTVDCRRKLWVLSAREIVEVRDGWLRAVAASARSLRGGAMLWRRVTVVGGRRFDSGGGMAERRRELLLLGRADMRRALSLRGSVRLVSVVAGADMRDGPVPSARSREDELRGKPDVPRDAAPVRSALGGAMVEEGRPVAGGTDGRSLRSETGTSAVLSLRGVPVASVDVLRLMTAWLRARDSSRCCSISRSFSVIVRGSSCSARLRVEALRGGGFGRR